MVRNKTIDFFKFVFSIGIIAIHVSFMKLITPQLYTLTANGLFRIGVPFFFVVSGYYFYGRVKNNQDTTSYIKKLIKLLLIFTGIESVIYLIPLFPTLIHPYAILAFIFRSLATGQGGIYWYMSSLIISLLLLKPLWKKGKIMPLLSVGLVLYILTATNDAYGGLFAGTIIQTIAKLNTFVFRWPQAGLCSSLLYLSIGAFVYEKKAAVSKVRCKLLLSLVLLLVEAYYLSINIAYDYNCYLSLIVVVPLLFIFLLENDFIPFETKRLGAMSTYMYMAHPLVIMVGRVVTQSSEWLFLFTVLVTTLLSYQLTKPKRT